MSIQNKQIAQDVLKSIGGPENIRNVYHCATRLRFTLINGNIVDRKQLEEVSGVISVLGKDTQLQVVIGNAVSKVYEELQELLPEVNVETVEGDTQKSKGIDQLFNIISGIFAPYLPLIMCSGILNGLLTLAVSMNWVDATTGTYAILSAAGNAVFYFFPILLSYTAAKQFKTNPFVAVVIGATLIQPIFSDLAAVEGPVSFLGIPVVMTSYASSVIPAILGVWALSIIDHRLTKILPDSIRSLVITLMGMIIVVPLTVLTFGPFGVYVSGLLGDGLSSLVSLNPIIAGMIAGGLCGYLAIFGLQWGIIPIIIINITNQGFDYFTPMWLMATYSQIGLALGVFLKTKDIQLRQLSASSFLTGLFTGITEPIIYGLLAKYKKLHIPFVTAGAVAGAIVGGFRVKQYSFVFGGILNFPGFIGDTFPFYLIGMITAIVLAAAMVFFMGYEDSKKVVEADIQSPVEKPTITYAKIKNT